MKKSDARNRGKKYYATGGYIQEPVDNDEEGYAKEESKQVKAYRTMPVVQQLPKNKQEPFIKDYKKKRKEKFKEDYAKNYKK